MKIKAFKAYRFDDSVVGSSADCIAPPYDVIDAEGQQALYEKNDYNIARLIKGKKFDTDNEQDNVYSRAANYLNDWIAKNAIKEDAEETIYAYVQNFSAAGRDFTRSGFIALGRLAAFGEGVQPHEKTLDGPKADRLNLTRATGAQFGQIFMLYDDPQTVADAIIAEAAQGEPLISLLDEENVTHKIYAITDDAKKQAIIDMMADKAPVIADGHHRYETALNYYNETKKPSAEYCMMTFVNMHNEGLVVLPTHRLVSNLEGFDMGLLITAMGQMFEIIEYSFADGDKQKAKDEMFKDLLADYDAGLNSFGVYGNDDSFYKVKLKSTDSIKNAAPELSEASQRLDVWVLHRLILDGILGIGDKQLASQSNLKYIKDIGDAIDRSIASVDSGKSQVVFFMNPTPVEQVKAVADAGEKMPQKSTFFYPKIFTGFTINKY
ncbi:MAG: DUF1015 domain-containing protein [Sedimentisphaeraceae bacterium JB056]